MIELYRFPDIVVDAGRLDGEIRDNITLSQLLDGVNTNSGLAPDCVYTDVLMTQALTADQYAVLSGLIHEHIVEPTIDTPIQFWDAMWTHPTTYDYKFVRARIRKAVEDNGWENLSHQEKTIAARWFVVDVEQRSEVYPLDQQVEFGMQYHNNSINARAARYKAAAAEVYNRLSRLQQIVIVGDVESAALPKLYVQYGIEGTNEGDVPGLFDYLEARNHTAYSGIGLAAKPFEPSGITMPQLVDKVMGILSSGLYDYSVFV